VTADGGDDARAKEHAAREAQKREEVQKVPVDDDEGFFMLQWQELVARNAFFWKREAVQALPGIVEVRCAAASARSAKRKRITHQPTGSFSLRESCIYVSYRLHTPSPIESFFSSISLFL
jgi:hypothetical protein